MSVFVKLTVNGTDHHVSLEGVSGQYWWGNDLKSVPKLALSYPDSGGFIKPSKGTLKLVNSFFVDAGLWKPPEKMALEIGWSREKDDTAQLLVHTGTARLKQVADTITTYSVWEPTLDANALTAGTNEQGDTVDIPLLVGTVSHAFCQRTGSDTEQRYYKAGISGTVGTHWHVFDDGVNIDSNVTDNGSTFSLSAVPVGTVTMSGTGTVTTLVGLFQWACGSGQLDKTLVATNAQDMALDFYLTSTTKTIDLLNAVIGYCGHVFWLSADQGTITLNSRNVNNGSRTLAGYEFYKAPYSLPNAIKEITATWDTNQAVSDSSGHRVESESLEAVALGPEPLGESIDTTAYNQTKSVVTTRLAALVTLWQQPTAEVTLPIPDTLIQPMEQLTLVDESFPQPLTLVINALGFSYDFAKGLMTVTGPGVVS